MVYKWKNDRFGVEAQKAGEEIERIEKTYGGIEPCMVVDESKPEDATLHNCFDWDNDKAGQRWREQQARVLICNLVSVQVGELGTEYETRTFVNVVTNKDENENGYVSMSIVLGNEDYQKQVLEQAKKEFTAFKKKYFCLKEFISVFKEYDTVFGGKEGNHG
jgi:hypothetical protein